MIRDFVCRNKRSPELIRLSEEKYYILYRETREFSGLLYEGDNGKFMGIQIEKVSGENIMEVL